jgi:hypothetical protein
MGFFARLLAFLRLTDAHDGQLSLTNLALIIVLVKLALAPSSPIDLATLLATLTAYYGKKVLSSRTSAQGADAAAAVAKADAAVTGQAETEKKLAELKAQLERTVSALNVSIPPRR